jgi:hypothetical protein
MFNLASEHLLGSKIHPSPITFPQLQRHWISMLLTAANLNTKNSFHNYPNCAISKAQQKKLNKLYYHPPTTLGGILNIIMYSVQNSWNSGANYWLLIQQHWLPFDFLHQGTKFFARDHV